MGFGSEALDTLLYIALDDDTDKEGFENAGAVLDA